MTPLTVRVWLLNNVISYAYDDDDEHVIDFRVELPQDRSLPEDLRVDRRIMRGFLHAVLATATALALSACSSDTSSEVGADAPPTVTARAESLLGGWG
jgi:hypothetical protein